MLLARTFTADDFVQDRRSPPLGDLWQAVVPLANPLGAFDVEIDGPPDAELLRCVNEYASALSDQYDAVLYIIHEDYLRAAEDRIWMKTCGVPRQLPEHRVLRYITSRSIYCGRGRTAEVGGSVFISPEWEPEHGLRLVLCGGRLVSNPG